MAFEDSLKKLISIHERTLNSLELRKAESGSNTPGHILNQIEHVKAEIAQLQSQIEEIQSGQVRELPEDIAWTYREAKEKLNDFQQKLETLSDELDDDMAEPAKVEAIVLLEYANQQRSPIESGWENLNTQTKITKSELEALIKKIKSVEQVISPLVIRQIHRHDLQRSKEQLESQQIDLLPDQLQKFLQPKLRQEKEAIQSLENQNELNQRQRILLESHRQNFELYKEMLAGDRPYAPLEVIRQILYREQSIQEIDTELASGKYLKEMEFIKYISEDTPPE